MDRFDRIYAFHNILRQARRPVPRTILQEKLECSRATVNRVIEDLRDFLGAPLEYDRAQNGYYYAETGEHPYELPGLWFNASELYALLAAQQLLATTQPGLLDAHLAPLVSRIEKILASEHMGCNELTRRIRILQMATRTAGDCFQPITGALMQRKRLQIQYHGRQRNVVTKRDISPQRLIHYRDNWYLDAWCHERNALRSFSLDRIHSSHTLDTSARELSDHDLDEYFTRTYGIFSGTPKHTAVLRFTSEAARWVADEQWHPEQHGQFHTDGSYELQIPYRDPRELIMDILKYGPDVEVIAPATLRKEVVQRLKQTMRRYEK